VSRLHQQYVIAGNFMVLLQEYTILRVTVRWTYLAYHFAPRVKGTACQIYNMQINRKQGSTNRIAQQLISSVCL
jgi:hypothetical protein